MASRSSEGRDNEGSRLGGARADFVASLGRKVQDAREVVAALEDDPASRAGARRAEAQAACPQRGGAAVALRRDVAVPARGARSPRPRRAILGSLREQEVAFVAQVVDDLPALAWGESPPRETPNDASEDASDAPGGMPVAVLVVGGEALADALSEDATLRPRGFESERTEDAQTALDLARAYAPDIVLVDADVPLATELVEALLDDPLTEPVPILVVGSFRGHGRRGALRGARRGEGAAEAGDTRRHPQAHAKRSSTRAKVARCGSPLASRRSSSSPTGSRKS